MLKRFIEARKWRDGLLCLTLLACSVGEKPERAGVGGLIRLHTSACAAVLELGNGYRSRGSVIGRGDVLPGAAK